KENIQELLNGIKDFSETAYQEGRDDKLPAFLEGVALLTDQDGEKEGDRNKVTLMTIHAAKGLEFANVFITGAEENLFPAEQCVTSPTALEEERRLFYVALTRAEKRAFISYAATRYKNGQVMNSRPSRFIGEIDQEYLEGYVPLREEPSGFRMNTPAAGSGHKPTITINRQASVQIPEIDRSRLVPLEANRVVPGMIIFHPTFGAGKVMGIEGLGVQKKAKVVFSEGGTRTLLLKFAKLYIEGEGK
ncbi:MAG: ATP-binding domain-containing protein, partial [Odoribacter sp.]|nr:ATP-binding domain-containing protein [Odoribacter sp.]